MKKGIQSIFSVFGGGRLEEAYKKSRYMKIPALKMENLSAFFLGNGPVFGEPFAVEMPDDEKNRAEYPVYRHGHPYADGAHAQAGDGKPKNRNAFQAEYIAQGHPEGPHGKQGYLQGEAHIAGGAEGSG